MPQRIEKVLLCKWQIDWFSSSACQLYLITQSTLYNISFTCSYNHFFLCFFYPSAFCLFIHTSIKASEDKIPRILRHAGRSRVANDLSIPNQLQSDPVQNGRSYCLSGSGPTVTFIYSCLYRTFIIPQRVTTHPNPLKTTQSEALRGGLIFVELP